MTHTIENLQTEIRERMDCPWCAHSIHDGSKTVLVDAHRWHVGCREDYDQTRYETWVSQQ
jgi:hypothetical protein